MLSEEEKAELREKARKDLEREKEEKRIRAELEEQEKAKEQLHPELAKQGTAKIEGIWYKIGVIFIALIVMALIGGILDPEGTSESQGGGSFVDSDRAYIKCIAGGITRQMCHEYSMEVFAPYTSDAGALMELRELCAEPKYHVHYAGLTGCVNAVNSFIYRLQRGDFDNL